MLFVLSMNFIPTLPQRERTHVTTPRRDTRSSPYLSLSLRVSLSLDRDRLFSRRGLHLEEGTHQQRGQEARAPRRVPARARARTGRAAGRTARTDTTRIGLFFVCQSAALAPPCRQAHDEKSRLKTWVGRPTPERHRHYIPGMTLRCARTRGVDGVVGGVIRFAERRLVQDRLLRVLAIVHYPRLSLRRRKRLELRGAKLVGREIPSEGRAGRHRFLGRSTRASGGSGVGAPRAWCVQQGRAGRQDAAHAHTIPALSTLRSAG